MLAPFVLHNAGSPDSPRSRKGMGARGKGLGKYRVCGDSRQSLRGYDRVLGASPDRPPGSTGPFGEPPYTHADPFHELFVLFGYLAGITRRLERSQPGTAGASVASRPRRDPLRTRTSRRRWSTETDRWSSDGGTQAGRRAGRRMGEPSRPIGGICPNACRVTAYLEECGRSPESFSIIAKIEVTEDGMEHCLELANRFKRYRGTHLSLNTMGQGLRAAVDHLKVLEGFKCRWHSAGDAE